ncbi:hypothetical protein H8B02_06555 [Bradyrhizobium sp. Pear77]|uniref:hypothetical protein n=1 Tax=Bradyrhizobium altum TaxID=1571202 RepID=UPI001E64776E|nr:hypothetical protein [Bradyrhizobium altum]MCC8953140.1 hypothetical protein [Bradyrhizobium altum]
MATRHRKVFVSDKLAGSRYEPLPQHHWITLQTKHDLRLPLDVRDKINAVCRILVENNRGAENLTAWTDVQKKLNNWRLDTARLRGNVWKRRAPQRKVQFESFRNLVEELFDPTLTDGELRYPLALLDRFLEGTIAVSEHIEECMRRWMSEHSYETELWLIWAALVLKHLENAGNEIKHPNRDRLKSAGPVVLIEKLQAHFPAALRRREAEALRKAVIAAYKISLRGSLQQLNEMLDHWCNGGDLLMARYSDKIRGEQFQLALALEKQLRLTTRFGTQRRKQSLTSESLEKRRQMPKPRRIELD